MSSLKDLDPVVLAEDAPEYKLMKGSMGTIVGVLEPGVFLVEFSDLNGETYAMEPFEEKRLIKVIHTKEEQQTA